MAKNADSACCALFEGSGAGHFVKMVHNGIEYALMQAIAEAYELLAHKFKNSEQEIADHFSAWNQSEIGSYLTQITVDILRTHDPDTGLPILDVIRDTAEQKGTGRWTIIEALQLGAAVPTIAQAVFARYISERKEERNELVDRI